jgi:hypothetical protein
MSFDETAISGAADSTCASGLCARTGAAPQNEMRQLALTAAPGMAGSGSSASSASSASGVAGSSSMTWLTPTLGAGAATATQLYAAWQLYARQAGASALLVIGVQSLLLWGIVFTMGTGSPAESWISIGALVFGVAYIAYSVYTMSRV